MTLLKSKNYINNINTVIFCFEIYIKNILRLTKIVQRMKVYKNNEYKFYEHKELLLIKVNTI